MASQLNSHILTSSATMVGVCTTVISLTKIIENQMHINRRLDEVLAVNAVLFMASALISYFSMRYTTSGRVAQRLEKLADGLFVAGMLLMTVCSVLFAFEFI